MSLPAPRSSLFAFGAAASVVGPHRAFVQLCRSRPRQAPIPRPTRPIPAAGRGSPASVDSTPGGITSPERGNASPEWGVESFELGVESLEQGDDSPDEGDDLLRPGIESSGQGIDNFEQGIDSKERNFRLAERILRVPAPAAGPAGGAAEDAKGLGRQGRSEVAVSVTQADAWRVRVCFWNVQNLFEVGAVARGPQSDQELQAKIERIGEVLTACFDDGPADLIGLAEIQAGHG